MAESEEELKSSLMRVKEESEKAGNETQHSKNEDHDIWSHHFMANGRGKSGNSARFYFIGLQNHCGQQINLKMLASWKKIYDKPRQHIKKQRHHFADKGPYSQNYGFFPIIMYRYESWIIKKAQC